MRMHTWNPRRADLLASVFAIATFAACVDGSTDTCSIGPVYVTPTTLTIAIDSRSQANVHYALSNCTLGRTVKWSSDDEAVAHVSSSGMITGVAIGGPILVRATVGDQSSAMAVTVVPAPIVP